MRRVVRPMLGPVIGTVLFASALSAHDLFIKLDTYFLSPGATVRVPVLNGTFGKSENAIERRRISDLTLVTPGGRQALDTGAVSAQGDTTLLALRLRGPGTYVVALSTRPSEISLAGRQFTAYLEDEAIRDVLDARAPPEPTGLRHPSAIRLSSFRSTIRTRAGRVVRSGSALWWTAGRGPAFRCSPAGAPVTDPASASRSSARTRTA